MIAITRAVVDLAQEAVKLPPSLTDKQAVAAYLTRLVPGLTEIISTVAQAAISGRLGLAGAANPELIRSEVARELEERGLSGLDPALIEAIITLVMAMIQLLAKR
jgi:hypothetical protein